MKINTPDAEKLIEEALDCILRLHGREQWSRMELDSMRDSFSYRVGALLVRHGRSPSGWIKAPIAVIREIINHRRRARARRGRENDERLPSITMPTDAKDIWVPLTSQPQVVLIPDHGGSWETWGTAIAPRTTATLTLALQSQEIAGRAQNANVVDQNKRHRALVIRRFKMRPGVPVRLLETGSGNLSLKLFRQRGAFCALKIELRDASGDCDPGASARIAKAKPQVAGSPVDEGARESMRPGQVRFSAAELESKLWCGFARYAIPELERIKSDTSAAAAERGKAAWQLTRWFYVEEDYERALDNIEFAKLLNPQPQAHLALAEAQSLVKLRRYEQADTVLERGNREHTKPDFQILRSSVIRCRELERGRSPAQADMAQLSLLNELYISAGLSPIRKIRPQDPLHISNITSDALAKRSDQPLKVSVIIPAYNAAESLGWVVESLLRQTWRNLEVIVVDDCSTDDTCQIVERIAEQDARVKLARVEGNGGAYAARNVGLRHASGDLITVHDSDDWSHPQRLELQVDALELNSAIVASKSHWVRVSENLEVIGAWILRGTVIDLNFSSLLFRKELLDVLGTWDEVLVSGDAEFYSRLKHMYGSGAVVKMPRDQLLAFSLTRESSLTRSKSTHLRSLYYGLRGNYRGSYLYWHSQLTGESEHLPLDPQLPVRKFPVPPRNRPPGKQGSAEYDMIVISDLAMRGGAFVSTLSYIIAACKAGKRVAVFHWRRFDLAVDAPLQARLYEACIEFGIDILGPGDSVQATVVLIGYPTILEHKIEPLPEIRAQQVVIVVNQFASRLVDGDDQQYDPLRVRAHLKSIFGTEGVWVPISAWVRRLMQEDRRYPIPYPKPWHPMIDSDAWCSAPIRWRGAERRFPVIGRHGRDTYTKWLSNPEELAQAYGVAQACEVRFLGGADHPVRILGGKPANWSVVPFDEMTAQDFLTDLDFYVHYPHEKYIEEFGRGVMEAMALGIPAILPPQFEETFGNAAIYALPAEVADVIAELWRSREKYLERAEAARAFVLGNCSISDFADRLDALLRTTETIRVDSDSCEHPAAAPSAAARQ